MFIEIHSLHTYIGALLNRDENGQAKRLSVGGIERTRISSQCLKRHWRTVEDEFALHRIEGTTCSVRSRNIIPELVIRPLREDPRFAQEVLDAVENTLNVSVHGSGAAAEQRRQTLLLGLPEVERLRERAAEICLQHPRDSAAATRAVERMFNESRPEGRSFRAMLNSARMPYGATAAMHGRMITSDPRANINSAVNVTHAFTVSGQESTPDFFTAVDDLGNREETASASLLSYSELNSGIYYGMVVDVRELVSNTEGRPAEEWMEADRELAALMVRNLIHLVSRVTPGAKRGSTAPYTHADLMLVETGAAQPRSLAKAYLTPCEPNVPSAIEALRSCLEKDDRAYRNTRKRAFTSGESIPLPEAKQMDIYELADWAAQRVRDGMPARAGA